MGCNSPEWQEAAPTVFQQLTPPVFQQLTPTATTYTPGTEADD